MVGESGGLDALAAALARSLTEAGARTIVSHHPDASTQAQEANAFNAEAYLGVMLGTGERSTIAYYATSGFESIGGHHLAELVVDELKRTTNLALESPAGMRLPVLRETKMPAVMCLLAPPDLVVACTAEIATALRRAVGQWIIAPAGRDGEFRPH
jgi:N-acetylmuramoyl-L-alanine amidase